jgi:hypothetical protein
MNSSRLGGRSAGFARAGATAPQTDSAHTKALHVDAIDRCNVCHTRLRAAS